MRGILYRVDSISRILSVGDGGIIYLGSPLPPTSSGVPGAFHGTAAPLHLFHLAPDGVCLAIDITADAGALLPHPFTLATFPLQSALCCTCRQVSLPGR